MPRNGFKQQLTHFWGKIIEPRIQTRSVGSIILHILWHLQPQNKEPASTSSKFVCNPGKYLLARNIKEGFWAARQNYSSFMWVIIHMWLQEEGKSDTVPQQQKIKHSGPGKLKLGKSKIASDNKKRTSKLIGRKDKPRNWPLLSLLGCWCTNHMFLIHVILCYFNELFL